MADTWAPIVEKDGKVVAVNGGGCVDIVSEKTDCGKAYFQWDLCLNVTCSKCEGSEASSCYQEAQSTACKDASEALVAACGGTEAEVNKHVSACFKAGEVTVKGAHSRAMHQGRREGRFGRLTATPSDVLSVI